MDMPAALHWQTSSKEIKVKLAQGLPTAGTALVPSIAQESAVSTEQSREKMVSVSP